MLQSCMQSSHHLCAVVEKLRALSHDKKKIGAQSADIVSIIQDIVGIRRRLSVLASRDGEDLGSQTIPIHTLRSQIPIPSEL